MAFIPPISAGDEIGIVEIYNDFATYLNQWTVAYNKWLEMTTGTAGAITDISTIAAGAGNPLGTSANWALLQERINLIVTNSVDWNLIVDGNAHSVHATNEFASIHMFLPDLLSGVKAARFCTLANAEMTAASVPAAQHFDTATWTHSAQLPWARTWGPPGARSTGRGNLQAKDQIGAAITFNQLWAACLALKRCALCAGDTGGGLSVNAQGQKFCESAPILDDCAGNLALVQSIWPAVWTSPAGFNFPEVRARRFDSPGSTNWQLERRRVDFQWIDVPTGTKTDIRIFTRCDGHTDFLDIDTDGYADATIQEVTTHADNTLSTRTSGLWGNTAADPSLHATVSCAGSGDKEWGWQLKPYLAVKIDAVDP